MMQFRVLGLCQCLVSLGLFSGVSVTGKVILDPPLGANDNGEGLELVVEKGSGFLLTCRSDSPVDWSYSDYDHYSTDEASEVVICQKNERGRFVSTLNLTRAYFMDTGYFFCYPKAADMNSDLRQAIYVYVRDEEHKLAVNDTPQIITKHQGETAVIPCRPTDPSLDVILEKDGDAIEMKSGIYEGTKVGYNPHIGFILSELSRKASGNYFCHTRKNGTNIKIMEDFIYILNVLPHSIAVQQPHITLNPSPVVEGMNVTFQCSIHYAQGVILDLKWIVPQHIESARIQMIDSIAKDDKIEDMVKTKEGFKKMILNHVTKQDEGDYICSVLDHSGNKNHESIKLKVLSEVNADIKTSLPQPEDERLNVTSKPME